MFEIKNKKIALLVAFLIILNLIPIWFFTYPPLQDYPQHLLLPKIINDYNNDELGYNKYFDLSFSLIPNIFSVYFILFLLKIFGLYVAGKLFLSLYIILFPLSVFYFINAVDKNKLLLGFFSFILTYSWFFSKGFIDFSISLVFFFFALGYWLKNKDEIKIREILLLSVLVLLVFFSHIFSFIILFIALFVLQIFYYKNKKQLIALALSFILPIIFFIIFLFSRAPDAAPFGISTSFNPITLLMSFFQMFFSFSPIFEAIILIAPLAYFISLFIKKILNKKAFLFKKIFDKKYKNEFLILSLILFLIFIFSPLHLATWSHFKARFMPFVFLLLLPWIGIPKKKRLFLFIVIAAAVLLTTLTFLNYMAINKDLADYASGIEFIEENKLLLPIIIKDAVGYNIRPYQHFWAYYNMEKGGITPYIFAGHSYHMIAYKEKMPSPKSLINLPGELSQQLNLSKDILAFYDYVLLWGRNKDVESFIISSGFSLLYEKGDLKLYLNRL